MKDAFLECFKGFVNFDVIPNLTVIFLEFSPNECSQKIFKQNLIETINLDFFLIKETNWLKLIVEKILFKSSLIMNFQIGQTLLS